MKFGIDREQKPTLRFAKTIKDAIVPTKGSRDAAGFDLYAMVPDGEVAIKPGETVKISTGIAMELPKGYFGGLFSRSGIATKKGLRPANCVGVIDSDYVGSIIVPLHNDSEEEQTVKTGERIAQLIIIPFLDVALAEVDVLGTTERGTGGFGSTGV